MVQKVVKKLARSCSTFFDGHGSASHKTRGGKPPLSPESIGRVAGNDSKAEVWMYYEVPCSNVGTMNIVLSWRRQDSPIERDTDHFSELCSVSILRRIGTTFPICGQQRTWSTLFSPFFVKPTGQPTSCSNILKDTLLHTKKFCSLEACSCQIQSDLPYRAAAETILLCFLCACQRDRACGRRRTCVKRPGFKEGQRRCCQGLCHQSTM